MAVASSNSDVASDGHDAVRRLHPLLAGRRESESRQLKYIRLQKLDTEFFLPAVQPSISL
ncbi:hypothetical protein OK016_05035 [Vibrio chagasii]|nr:hypothetical protein [Vibrio chagasii]